MQFLLKEKKNDSLRALKTKDNLIFTSMSNNPNELVRPKLAPRCQTTKANYASPLKAASKKTKVK